jgi:hypothetical protein
LLSWLIEAEDFQLPQLHKHFNVMPNDEPSLMAREKYQHTGKMRQVLKDKSELGQEHGLNYLIPNWKRFADHADTEDLIYEWLKDLDARRIIDEILATLSETERKQIEQDLKPIDDTVLAKTFEVNECVWGERVEKENNYNRQKQWYYYRMNENVFESESGRFTKRH